jgi:hypothetical protein
VDDANHIVDANKMVAPADQISNAAKVAWNAAIMAAAKECDHHSYQLTVTGRDITKHLKKILLKKLKK